MGWGRWFLLGDFGQQLDLSDYQRELQELRSQVRMKVRDTDSIDDRVKELQRENDELKLYVAAMLRLLTTKGIATKNEISALVDAIDESDGVKDGRYLNRIDPAP